MSILKRYSDIFENPNSFFKNILKTNTTIIDNASIYKNENIIYLLKNITDVDTQYNCNDKMITVKLECINKQKFDNNYYNSNVEKHMNFMEEYILNYFINYNYNKYTFKDFIERKIAPFTTSTYLYIELDNNLGNVLTYKLDFSKSDICCKVCSGWYQLS